MASTKYTYGVAEDFTGLTEDAPNLGRLSQEITSSAIVTALDFAQLEGDGCDIWFKAELSSGDVAILDGLVAAHTGVPLPVYNQVTLHPDLLTADNRLQTRTTIAQMGRHRMRCLTFYTSDPTKLHNMKCDYTDYGDVVQKEFNSSDEEITEAPYSASVVTQLDFEPDHDYEIIGGEVSVPEDLRGGVTDAWYAACIGVPDVPEAQGGNVNFVNCANLEAFDGTLDIDGRATTYMTYNADYHTGKIRFLFRHPAGASKRFQIFLELFS